MLKGPHWQGALFHSINSTIAKLAALHCVTLLLSKAV